MTGTGFLAVTSVTDERAPSARRSHSCVVCKDKVYLPSCLHPADHVLNYEDVSGAELIRKRRSQKYPKPFSPTVLDKVILNLRSVGRGRAGVPTP